LGGLMFLHFIGMFGLSRIVGGLTDRLGRRYVMSVGISLLACGGAVVALVSGPMGFGIGLLLVGLGWSFGFIASTVVLTDVTPPDRRGRVLGRADLTAQLCSAVIAIGGGWWFAQHGVAGLGLVAIAVALVPILFLVWMREASPGQYGNTVTPKGIVA